MKISDPELALASSLTLPNAPRLDRSVSIQGTGAEHVDGVKGAVDRIAIEILRRLEKGRTLVVWTFDASGSLVSERERLAKYIDEVYAHIVKLDQDQRAEEGGLLTAVVSFGKDRKILTETPTDDRQAIVSAIGAVPIDTTGFESTFQTVADIARKFGRFKQDGKPYQVMTIIVTDEVGDDEDELEGGDRRRPRGEDAGVRARLARPVRPRDGVHGLHRPEDQADVPPPAGPPGAGKRHAGGGQAAVLVRWPAVRHARRGVRPLALSRLAGTTGGIYFVTRMGPNRITFDPAAMREYRPDWVSKAQYVDSVNKHPVRKAVMMAAEVAQQNLPGQPSMTFPAADSPQFKDAMRQNQEVVARVEYTIDMALPPITAALKSRDHETSRRWQAHYDLIRARLFAVKLRCHEYNAACAAMKKDPKKFADPAHNAWKLVPDPTVRSSEKAAEVAKETKALLERIVQEHPGTPWALLAQRELKDPFGFRWEEVYVKPPPPPGADNNNEPKPEKPSKPVEVPKL